MLIQFSSLIGKLYDVVTNPNRWEIFLSELIQVFRSDGAHLVNSDLEEEKVSFSIYYGEREISLDKYLEYAFDQNDDERLRFGLSHPYKPYHTGMLPDLQRHYSSRVYREFLEPNGVHHFLTAGMPDDGGDRRQSAIAVWRERSGGPYTDRDCEFFSEIIPHLRRVIDLRSRFIASQLTDNPAIEVVQKVPIGVILTDAWSHVHFANTAAQDINRRHGSLIMRHGELWGDRPEATRRLREHIRMAAAGGVADKVPPALTMRIDSPATASHLLVMVSGITNQSAVLRDEIFRQGTAVVYISDPEVRQETTESLLQRLFALTMAEARLLKALVGGNSLQEAARLSGVSESTARSYLKQVFAKTNTHRQADLVAMVANSPAWLKHQTSPDGTGGAFLAHQQ